MYRQPSQPANKGTIEVEDAAFLFAVRNCLSEPIAHGASGRNFSTLNRLASSTFRQEPVMSSLRIFRANAFFFFLVLILLVGSQQIARSQSIGGGLRGAVTNQSGSFIRYSNVPLSVQRMCA